MNVKKEGEAASAGRPRQPGQAPAQLPDQTSALDVGKEVNELLEKAEKAGTPLHLAPVRPLRQPVGVVLLRHDRLPRPARLRRPGGLRHHPADGRPRPAVGRSTTGCFEFTGLYWHFVDIVWIFLFPLLYLV